MTKKPVERVAEMAHFQRYGSVVAHEKLIMETPGLSDDQKAAMLESFHDALRLTSGSAKFGEKVRRLRPAQRRAALAQAAKIEKVESGWRSIARRLAAGRTGNPKSILSAIWVDFVRECVASKIEAPAFDTARKYIGTLLRTAKPE